LPATVGTQAGAWARPAAQVLTHQLMPEKIPGGGSNDDLPDAAGAHDKFDEPNYAVSLEDEIEFDFSSTHAAISQDQHEAPF
jgi:hypothetical protein